jgi:hypothetical protein
MGGGERRRRRGERPVDLLGHRDRVGERAARERVGGGAEHVVAARQELERLAEPDGRPGLDARALPRRRRCADQRWAQLEQAHGEEVARKRRPRRGAPGASGSHRGGRTWPGRRPASAGPPTCTRDERGQLHGVRAKPLGADSREVRSPRSTVSDSWRDPPIAVDHVSIRQSERLAPAWHLDRDRLAIRMAQMADLGEMSGQPVCRI